MAVAGCILTVIFLLYGAFTDQTPFRCRFQVSPELLARVNLAVLKDGSELDEADPTVQLCKPTDSQCMVVWHYDPETNDTSPLMQGCWRGNNGDCDNNECIAHRDLDEHFFPNSRFCCCSTELCNDNFTYVYVPSNKSHDQIEVLLVKKTSGDWVPSLVVGCVLLLFTSSVVAYLVYRFGFRVRKPLYKIFSDPVSAMDSSDADALMARKLYFYQHLTENAQFQSDDILVTDLIARGRYSKVWRGVHKATGAMLSIKIYEQPYGYYYYNESMVFTLPFMNHENVVPFFGVSEQMSTPLKYCLATRYMSGGSLQAFMKANTYDWPATTKMILSIARGLAHLHTEIRIGDSYKPVVVHRDLNSRNILMKQDGSCCLCDFGFAYAMNAFKDKGILDDDVSLAEVGTVRYMAPELLEGAANLSDPQTTLQQVDVYALGLVFWEILTRCSDVYASTGHAVPEYRMPYEKEVSNHPTLEQMQQLVCKKKHRPAFPLGICRQTSGPFRTIRELIEDCWDQDCDARITSICAQERLIELYNDSRILLPNGRGRGSPTKQRIFAGGGGQFQANGLGQLVRSNVSSLELRRPFYPGESSADTSRTGTSGIGSLSQTSTDRGRSSNSSSLASGYQTNRSDSPYYGRNAHMEHNTLSEMSGEMTEDHLRGGGYNANIGGAGQFGKLPPVVAAEGFACQRDSEHPDAVYLSNYENKRVDDDESARLFNAGAAQDDLFAALLLKCGSANGAKLRGPAAKGVCCLPNGTAATETAARLTIDCVEGRHVASAVAKDTQLHLFPKQQSAVKAAVGGT